MIPEINQLTKLMAIIEEGEKKVRMDDENLLNGILSEYNVVAGNEPSVFEVQVPKCEGREAVSSLMKHTIEGLLIDAESVTDTGSGVLVKVVPDSEQEVLFESFRMD